MALLVVFNNTTDYDMYLDKRYYEVGGGTWPKTWDVEVEASDVLKANAGVQRIEIRENGLAALGQNVTRVRALWGAEYRFYAGVAIERAGGVNLFSGNHIKWESAHGVGPIPNGLDWVDRGDRVSPLTEGIGRGFTVTYKVEYTQKISTVVVDIQQGGE